MRISTSKICTPDAGEAGSIQGAGGFVFAARGFPAEPVDGPLSLATSHALDRCMVLALGTRVAARTVAAVLLVAAEALATPADAACPARPRPLCRDLGQTRVKIDAISGDFDWRGTLGPSTTLAEFGQPGSSTALSLCAWDNETLLVSVEIPAAATCGGVACWSSKGQNGLRYRDGDGALRSVELLGSSKARTRIRARGAIAAGAALPIAGRLTVQLLRDDSPICFEGAIPGGENSINDAQKFSAKARMDPATVVPVLPSPGCDGALPSYVAGTSNLDQVLHNGLVRTFRVYVPPSYDDGAATPVVFLLHGGFGSGAQIEASTHMLEVAAAEGVVVISPDGVANPGAIRTWNAGGCCGYAASADVDDVGFLAAALDRVEEELCVDTRRVYATGMSNGAMLSHRLGCDLADRVRAIATVAGTDITTSCSPARPVPELTIHGSADMNVPFVGGTGCGPSGASYRSVPLTLQRWRELDDCSEKPTASYLDADAACTVYGKCAAGNTVESCIVDGGGHQWPGGEPPSVPGIGDCLLGFQSVLYPASARIWEFFAAHPAR